MFGYDIGVTGGVIGMKPFLELFWPGMLTAQESSSPYCKFEDPTLALFVSSLFLAGALTAIIGSAVTTKFGRKTSMLLGGGFFLAGAVLCGSAQHIAMLILGRVFLGFGVGFGNQAVPLFLSEMAPFNVRGALNIMFQIATTLEF